MLPWTATHSDSNNKCTLLLLVRLWFSPYWIVSLMSFPLSAVCIGVSELLGCFESNIAVVLPIVVKGMSI